MSKSLWLSVVLLLLVLITSLACQKTPAEFSLISLDITPSEVVAGETFSINAQVKNIGETEGAYTATLIINGVTAQTKVVKIEPRKAGLVSFEVVQDKPGRCNVQVNELSGTFRVLRPAEFVLGNLIISPSVVEVGKPVTITADVINSGEAEGSYSVRLLVDKQQMGTKELTVAPGTTEKVSFTLNPDKTSNHVIEIGGLSGALFVVDIGDALVKLNTAYPELYQELLKLPDLKEIDGRDKEAIDDIIGLALNQEYLPAFKSMLDEGVKSDRKYCSPLEGLLWIAYDREFDGANPLQQYSVAKLINDAWKNTTTSNKYNSDRWKDFDEVVDRLISTELVTIYCLDNLSYDFADLEAHLGKGRPFIAQPAELTFDERKGVCQDHSRFILYCLNRNGYTYDDFNVNTNHAACVLDAGLDKIEGHATCLYVQDGKFYIIDSGTPFIRGIKGPFATIEQAADATYPGYSYYGFRDANNKITKEVY